MNKIIALDCDGVLSDFVAGVLKWSKSIGLTNTREQITDFNIFKAWNRPDLWPAFSAEVAKKHWVSTLPVIDGAVSMVDDLRRLGEVVIVTSPYKGAPYWMQERNDWLEKHFGFMQKDIIHATHKHLIRADFLIDDAAHNIEKFPGIGLLVDQPWNRECTSGIMCKSYEEVLDTVGRMA